MLLELFKVYATGAKLVLFITLAAAVGIYVTYLKFNISSLEGQVKGLKEAAQVCETERTECQATVKIQEQDIKILNQYHESKRPLDMRDGELTPEELDAWKSRKTK